MNMVFLMDPLETVHPEKDTTYAFMIGAARRGHTVGYLHNRGITLRDDLLWFEVETVKPTPGGKKSFQRGAVESVPASRVDALFIRTDPPFNDLYLHNTWLLDYAPDRMIIVNRPSGIRTVNEKLWCLQFAALIPPTLVTSSLTDAQHFIAEHGKVVIKPTDGHGGQGVFVVGEGDSNANVIMETLSGKGQRVVLLQEYEPASEIGDKRILLLDGEPLGAVLRVHNQTDHRNNFFAGGSEAPTEINDRDRVIIETLRPELCRLGLWFVGIDILGGSLIEVNVTSPTCLQEMNRLGNLSLEDRVIEWVEARASCNG